MAEKVQQTADQREVVLQVEGITKRFPGVLANDNVNLTLHRGEILALLGENGAGKSTLMNIIYGLYHPDEGTIRLRGKPVYFASPREAIHSGIGMVHQHFQLIPVMTVAENVILGEESTAMRRPRRPADETPAAGWVRLIWGLLWRLVIPFLAVGLGALLGLVTLLLVLSIATYIPQGQQFATTAYQRMPLVPKAEMALTTLYLENETSVKAALLLPDLIGAFVGAAVLVLGYRHARRTWRGRERYHASGAGSGLLLSPLDAVIDAAIDLVGTSSAVQDKQQAAERVHELSKQFNLEVDPAAYIEKLPVGLQQRVEIVKALYRKADILILDEPTAVLTPQESQELFRIMRELAAQGVSIIFITHKLKEVFAVADSIVVMRNGRVVGVTTPGEASEESLAAMMVGREVMLKVNKTRARPGEVVLAVEDLSAMDDRGTKAVDRVSFEVRSGEVLGIAGVQGNGQTELVEVLTGLRKPTGGRVLVNGQDATGVDPRGLVELDASHVPEDRHRFGMVRPFSVADNLVLNRYYVNPFARFPSLPQLGPSLLVYLVIFGALNFFLISLWSSQLYPQITAALGLDELRPRTTPGPFIVALLFSLGTALAGVVITHYITSLIVGLGTRLLKPTQSGGLTIDEKAVTDNAVQLIKEFDIRTPSPALTGGNLSGGNQQKMVVARELSRRPRLLIASQPTRGIDVGSIEFIHNRLIEQRDEGAAVLLVSAELDEIMALSDRIAVMYKGRIIDIVPGSEATREQLGLLMAGIRRDWAAPWRTVSEVSEVQPEQAN